MDANLVLNASQKKEGSLNSLLITQTEPLQLDSTREKQKLNGADNHDLQDEIGVETSAHPEPNSESAVRQVCYRLVETMPKEGLAEMLETLEYMREFYHLRATTPLPPPPPQPKPIRVKVGPAIIRPAFPFDIDDYEE